MSGGGTEVPGRWGSRLRTTTSPATPRKVHEPLTTGKSRQGKNGISGFMQNILSSKKKTANFKKANNLPSMRIQGSDVPVRKASPHSQPPLSDQNVECMVYYESHELNASLSSGSDKGSHTGSASGSGSSNHVIYRKNRLPNERLGNGKSSPRFHIRPNGTPPSVSSSIPQVNSGTKPSLYAHGDLGSTTLSQDLPNHGGHLSQIQTTSVQSGPAYSNIRPSTYRNHSTGNYLPMDQYLYKDSGAGSSVSGSTRQEETTSSLGLEDSGIDIGTAAYLQQTGYASSRASAYSHDDYLLPLSHRVGVINATEEQLKHQELQLKRQEQQLQELQKQHFQIKQQLQHQQQAQQVSLQQPTTHPEQIEMTHLNVRARTMPEPNPLPELPAKPGVPGHSNMGNSQKETHGLSSTHEPTSSNNPVDPPNNSVPTPTGIIGKYGRKSAVKHRTSELTTKSTLSQPSQSTTATQESQVLARSGNGNLVQSGEPRTSRREINGKQYARKHKFAPQEGYTEIPMNTTSRSSVRSSRSTSSKGSSSHARAKASHDPSRPVAANIILNIPGYRVPGALGRNKRLSSAEESDMESMTSVSVTSREVANIMTQAMRMQRSSTRRRSKCEHHHRTFATKPGRSGNLSRSSNLRGSNSSNRSKGRKSCTRCGSQSQRPAAPEKNGESLISFIEQSMRSFLLNSSETVSTEDTSSETKSSSMERNKTPSDESTEHNNNNPATTSQDSPPSNSSKLSAHAVSHAPTLFDITSHCELRTIEMHNDHSNTLGYGMHLQQVNFNPRSLASASSGKLASNGVHLGQGSTSAFDRFQGRTRLIYCVHMLDKAGIAAKHGALKEGDYLVEVNGVNCLEKSDEALLEVLSQETDSLKLLIARGHHREPQEFFA